MEGNGTIDQRLDRLTIVVDSLAASVVAHEGQLDAHAENIKELGRDLAAQAASIRAMREHAEEQGRTVDKLIILADRNSAELTRLAKEWQAYLSTIHPRH